MDSAESPRTRSGDDGTSPSESNPYSPPGGGSLKASPASAEPAAAHEPALYDSVFWSCYAANFLMMTSLSMLARYSDFVKSIGGDETRMGWIVGFGALGAMAARLFQGQWIDRVGARSVWLVCLAVTTTAMLAHVFAESADSPYIFVVRLMMWMAVAGNFSASITLVSRRAPLARVTEAVGTLGSSGFIGLALGPLMADQILGDEPTRPQIVRWILACTCLFAMAMSVMWLGARGERSGSIHKSPPLWQTLRRYAPWPLLVMSFVTGAGLNLPTYYVRPFSENIGFEGVGTFFVAYGISAFSFRWLLFDNRVTIIVSMQQGNSANALTSTAGNASLANQPGGVVEVYAQPNAKNVSPTYWTTPSFRFQPFPGPATGQAAFAGTRVQARFIDGKPIPTAPGAADTRIEFFATQGQDGRPTGGAAITRWYGVQTGGKLTSVAKDNFFANLAINLAGTRTKPGGLSSGLFLG